MLLAIPSTLAISKAMQLIKGASSKWMSETFPTQEAFQWQEGYAAFSIGVSGIDKTVAYIGNQLEHHKVKTFEEEFISFLECHGVAYDPRYVFD